MRAKEKIENEINKLIHEKLFSAIRKIIIQKNKDSFIKTTEYANSQNKQELLNKHYKIWYESISSFFLSLRSIYALHPLILRELKIRDFIAEEVIRVKADYIYNGIEFSAYYPTHYNSSMTKEIEDCISELKNPKYTHKVDNYTLRVNTERAPHEPLTTAELKYSSFYLFGFEPDYVTSIAKKLYRAGLITNPETNGWKIEDSIIEDIITVLNQKFKEENVLQYKRTFSDKAVDRMAQECIRPTIITSKRFPKNIDKTDEFNSIDFIDDIEQKDALKLYEFIFYMTLSTQMKNSIYDTSKIEISVGNKKLVEQANIVLEGQENWELLTGELIKRISNNDGSWGGQVVVLPEIAPEEVLKPLDIYAYSYQSKRPPRYGIGRFITQILEKNNIASNQYHDLIVNELISSKAVYQVKTMLHPQESSIILISWLKEYLPSFLDLEYLSELEEKMILVESGELTLASVLDEINRLIDAAFEISGYIEDDSKPSQNKINLVKAVALKHNLNIDEAIFSSNVKMDMILAQYPMPEPIKVGLCPSCNALVYQKEFIDKNSGEVSYYFSCENFKRNGGCSFSIWDSYIYKYFSDKGVELYVVEERADALKKILSKKKGYLFNDFIAKNQKPYDAKVYIEPYKDKKTQQEKWAFALNFVNPTFAHKT